MLRFVNSLSMRNQQCDEIFMSKLMQVIVSLINHDQSNKNKISEIFFQTQHSRS